MAARLTLIALLVLGLGACAPSGGGVITPQPPASTSGPTRTVGPVVAQTRAELVRVLGSRNLVLQDSVAPFRPPEDARFTATPRALYQVILPQAPHEGFIVVYEFADPTAAAEAASAQAAYLATGPAKVQSAFGARHIIRLVGPTVVLYSWVPEGAEDPLHPDIQVALETLGTGVTVPS
ncbi:MAG TPA: hypothetical protein VHK05_00145 [Candidatus Limnocylindrales bacterium]|jgi:hypothetical protein|nr:hypothetical protein [Candidatus Limnocylindrales bacterium]